jgi:hypothetical protein
LEGDNMSFEGEKLIGKTIKEIYGAEKYSEEITFITECAERMENESVCIPGRVPSG